MSNTLILDNRKWLRILNYENSCMAKLICIINEGTWCIKMERQKAVLQELMLVLKDLITQYRGFCSSFEMLCQRFIHTTGGAFSNVISSHQSSGALAASASHQAAVTSWPSFKISTQNPQEILSTFAANYCNIRERVSSVDS